MGVQGPLPPRKFFRGQGADFGGTGFARGGARPFWDAREGRAPPRPHLFCASTLRILKRITKEKDRVEIDPAQLAESIDFASSLQVE